MSLKIYRSYIETKALTESVFFKDTAARDSGGYRLNRRPAVDGYQLQEDASILEGDFDGNLGKKKKE